MAKAAWITMAQQETSEMSPDTAAAFALGKEKFVALAVEPNKVIQKAWKNRVQNQKIRKSEAISGAGRDEALVVSPEGHD